MQEQQADRIVKNLARRLRQRREELELSMNHLADLCALDQRSISRIEKGERSPTLRTLLKIADALELKISDLLREAGQ